MAVQDVQLFLACFPQQARQAGHHGASSTFPTKIAEKSRFQRVAAVFPGTLTLSNLAEWSCFQTVAKQTKRQCEKQRFTKVEKKEEERMRDKEIFSVHKSQTQTYLMCSGPYLNEECVVKCITKVDNIFNPGTWMLLQVLQQIFVRLADTLDRGWISGDPQLCFCSWTSSISEVLKEEIKIAETILCQNIHVTQDWGLRFRKVRQMCSYTCFQLRIWLANDFSTETVQYIFFAIFVSLHLQKGWAGYHNAQARF